MPDPAGVFRLSQIPARDRISELEFYFPLQPVTPEKLGKVFAGHGGERIPPGFPARLEELDFQPVQGFMKGYQDLVFHYRGRFYLVDWKSNFLGKNPEDYHPQNLAGEMNRQYLPSTTTSLRVGPARIFKTADFRLPLPGPFRRGLLSFPAGDPPPGREGIRGLSGGSGRGLDRGPEPGTDWNRGQAVKSPLTMEILMNSNSFSPLDVHFAGLMARLSETGGEALLLAAALASRYQGLGHVCCDLSTLAGRRLLADQPDSPACPELENWIRLLGKTEVVGRPGEYRPLVLAGPRLYLYRYWEYEKKLIDFIKERTATESVAAEEGRLRGALVRLFPPGALGETDGQKTAALAAALKDFCVISGGPGTGKTFTVAKILALWQELWRVKPGRIALAAPTGKAAARLQEAIKKTREGLECAEEIKAAIPVETSTIHRLLKSIPYSPYFQFNSDHPLPVDLVVVDEASMVDLALLSKLVQAIPREAKLILLGDKDQLASVEAGAVLGDICGTGTGYGFSRGFQEWVQRVLGEELEGVTGEGQGPAIRDSIIQLKKSYRFRPGSGLGALSRAVNAGDGQKALSLLMAGDIEAMDWRDLPRPEGLRAELRNQVLQGFSGHFRPGSPEEAFDFFGRFRILCALREGPYGVRAVNLLVEQILRKENLITREGRWYPGRPVMVTRNEYALRLFNGDLGIVLADPEEKGALRVFFQAPEGGLRKFPPLRLPEHETVYALTVHKSQGSEFDRVILVLPDRDAPVLSRELVYTGITRARERVEIWGREAVFRQAVARRTRRSSGLQEALWGPDRGNFPI